MYMKFRLYGFDAIGRASLVTVPAFASCFPRPSIQWRWEEGAKWGGGTSAPGGTVQRAAFGGAKIWNSENWPLLANWRLHCRTGWFVSAASHPPTTFLPPFLVGTP